MTENKLQCYVKSLKSDVIKVTTESVSPLKKGVLNLLLLVAIGLIGIGIIYVMFEVLVPFLETIGTRMEPVITEHVTQYGTYLAILVVIDLLLWYAIRSEPDKSDVVGDVHLSLILLIGFFGVNAVFTYGSPADSGWSYMIIETVVNAVVLITGILLLRAHTKCKKPDEAGVQSS
jgi:hypothetical protein